MIADSLGLSSRKFRDYLNDWPEFRQAYEAGKKQHAASKPEWVDDALSDTWKRIRDATGDSKQEMLMNLASNGERRLQMVLATALCETFDLNRCLRALKIPPKKFRDWMRTDPEFREMLEDIEFSKKNLAESRLMELVRESNVKAVLFANESLNRETYGRTMEINNNHHHVHTIGMIDLSSVPMPIELRVKLVEAIRKSGLTDPDGLLAFEAGTVEGEAKLLN